MTLAQQLTITFSLAMLFIAFISFIVAGVAPHWSRTESHASRVMFASFCLCLGAFIVWCGLKVWNV